MRGDELLASHEFRGRLLVGELQRAAAGFGLLPNLLRTVVPAGPGVYAVVTPPGYVFSLRKEVRRGKWLRLEATNEHQVRCPHTDIIYIGKAGGPGTKETLQGRIEKLVRHGLGKTNNHKGGQDIWLLKEDDTFLLYWRECDSPRAVEKQLIAEFKNQHQKRPFGNKQD